MKAVDAEGWCIDCKLSFCIKCVYDHAQCGLQHTGEKPHVFANIKKWPICDEHTAPCGLICANCKKGKCSACIADRKTCSQHDFKEVNNCIENLNSSLTEQDRDIDDVFEELRQKLKAGSDEVNQEIEEHARDMHEEVCKETNILLDKVQALTVEAEAKLSEREQAEKLKMADIKKFASEMTTGPLDKHHMDVLLESSYNGEPFLEFENTFRVIFEKRKIEVKLGDVSVFEHKEYLSKTADETMATYGKSNSAIARLFIV